ATAPRDRAVSIWNVKAGQVIHNFEYELAQPASNLNAQHLLPVAFSPDGSRIAAGTADGAVWVWDVRTRQLVKSYLLHSGVVVWGLVYSPDGRRVASAGDDKIALIWDSETGRVTHKLSGHTAPITSLAFNRGGTRLASCSFDKTVKVWDATSGERLNSFNDHM